jgi:hypothetical protein
MRKRIFFVNLALTDPLVLMHIFYAVCGGPRFGLRSGDRVEALSKTGASVMLPTGIKAAERGGAVAGSALLVAALVAAILFMLSVFWGGIQFLAGDATLSVTRPWAPLLVALTSALLCDLVKNRHEHHVSRATQENARHSEPVTFFTMASVMAGIALASIWMMVYRVYGARTLSFVPTMLALHIAAGTGGWRLFLKLARCQLSGLGVLGAGLWIFSAMLVRVSWPAVMAYGLTAALAFLWKGDSLSSGLPTKRIRWAVAFALALLLAGGSAWAGHGWATGRLVRRLALMTHEGIWGIPLALGCVSMVFSRRHFLSRQARAFVWLFLPAAGLMGARGAWGDAGLALWVPCFVTAFCSGVVYAERWLQRKKWFVVRNVAFMCLMGAALGWIRHGPVPPVYQTTLGQQAAADVVVSKDCPMRTPVPKVVL